MKEADELKRSVKMLVSTATLMSDPPKTEEIERVINRGIEVVADAITLVREIWRAKP